MQCEYSKEILAEAYIKKRTEMSHLVCINQNMCHFGHQQ